MGLKAKIIIFLITVLTAVSLNSCKKSKYDVIPDVYVDFYINLNDPEFFDLNAPMNYKIITSKTNNWGSNSGGYNDNGIIVYRLTDEFYAYDRTCPHDFAVNSKSIKLNIDGIYAVCPECGTTYALPSFGTPASGIGRYPLKNYKTSFNGQIVHVWHYL
jgi:nitrite reductase/ring-hydroxylating ferredoxin subunit